jgi:hypothetical protein
MHAAHKVNFHKNCKAIIYGRQIENVAEKVAVRGEMRLNLKIVTLHMTKTKNCCGYCILKLIHIT